MTPSSPSANAQGKLVFGLEELPPDDDDIPDDLKTPDELSRSVSMYVRIFAEMLTEVIQSEPKLFNAEETGYILRYHKDLSDREKFLFVRLCLRKHQWIRLSDLKYGGELGTQTEIAAVAEQLCSRNENGPVPGPSSLLPKPKPRAKGKAPEVIDLTGGDDDDTSTPGPLPSVVTTLEPAPLPESEDPAIPNYSVFAHGESKATDAELLDCLRLEELKDLAKTLKIQHTKTRRDKLIKDLLKYQTKQTSLLSYFTSKDGDPLMTRFRELVMNKLQRCVRLNVHALRLIDRVNLVYFRSTIPTPLMQPAILSSAKKRAYAPQGHRRTPYGPWPTREALLQYEEALSLEAEVDELLDGWSGSSKSSSSTSSMRARSTSVLSRTPAPSAYSRDSVSRGMASVSPTKTRASVLSTAPSAPLENTPEPPEEQNVLPTVQHNGGALPDPPRKAAARLALDIFHRIYNRWKLLVQLPSVKSEDCVETVIDPPQQQGLERFHYGHILTRIVCKGAYAHGIIGDADQELEILENLLAQKRFRRGRRGRWHERRACILMHHKQRFKAAYTAVREAIDDPDTHIVYLPKLHRRLLTLQKKLRGDPILGELPLSFPQLKTPPQVSIVGTRVHGVIDQAGRLVADAGSKGRKRVKLEDNIKQEGGTSSTQAVLTTQGTVETKRAKGKSIWVGKDGEFVHVEIFALEHYEKEGYKGLHSEGSILRTLFGLLFWDIILADIPGAFETEYQSAPLDIVEDTFYQAREGLIETRLEEIRKGQGRTIVEGHWDEHAVKNTFCVGVRWDLLPKEDILDIVDFFDPNGLATICQTICQDYTNRGGGVPDLFLWHPEQKTCKFVEVKGPGDTLQENQKLWIDVLLTAQVPVKVCHVIEEGTKKTKGKGKGKSSATPGKKPQKRTREEVDSDVEEPFVAESDDEDTKPATRSKGTKRKRETGDILPTLFISSQPLSQPLQRPPNAKDEDVEIELKPVVGLLVPRGVATPEADENVPSSQTTVVSQDHSPGRIVEVVVDLPPHKRRRKGAVVAAGSV